MAQINKSKTKSNAYFYEISECLNEMKWWTIGNLDSLLELTQMIEWENDINYIALDNFPHVRENFERELNNFLTICTKLHKECFILTFKGHLALIGELGQPNSYDQVFSKLEKDMR
jgi:hypothetical protein